MKIYYLYFYNEQNKLKKYRISTDDFVELKELLQTRGLVNIYILKYPKYKKGYKYHVFYPEDKFQNLSSIKEKSKNSIQ